MPGIPHANRLPACFKTSQGTGCYVGFQQGRYFEANASFLLQVPKRTARPAGMSGLLTAQLHSMLQQEEHMSARGDGNAVLEVHSSLSCPAQKHVPNEQRTVVYCTCCCAGTDHAEGAAGQHCNMSLQSTI